MPDYAERAVTEALVNALIHRDYLIMGSEIHIDIYDDRLEISSPGGMYSGKMIQDLEINKLKSERRNPVIADLFHRMKYMERRGSGLNKILQETQKLHGYDERYSPEFYSSVSSFTVILKNVNYTDGQADVKSVGINDGINIGINETQKKIIELLINQPEFTAEQLSAAIGITKRRIEANISHLKKLGLIEREGAKKNGRWSVK
jgi:ATP-dependent DNA helicase RecG